ncbi:MAG: hypothetical protein KF799_11360 [Bdellovibrionales bacterium]|nr:hypothetical protein [Bdellovibrionales bacterium]
MKFLSLAVAVTFGFAAFAQEQTQSTEAQTKLKIEDTKEKNKVDGDIDQEITNAKLRAESGSKSKWSGSASISYMGSSLETPLGNERPNTAQEAVAPPVSMGGSLAIRYRMTKNQSLTAGVGWGLDSPWEKQEGNVSDPYLSYNYVGKIKGVQNIATVAGSVITNNQSRSIGQNADLGVSNIMMYDFDGSKFTVGLILAADRGFFGEGNAARQREWTFGAYVPMEYAFNDTVQLRTVFRPWTVYRTAAQESWTFNSIRWTQSLGVAVAVTRDINLYPNFQWDVEQWRGNDYNFFSKDVRANSTVGLQAAINVF